MGEERQRRGVEEEKGDDNIGGRRWRKRKKLDSFLSLFLFLPSLSCPLTLSIGKNQLFCRERVKTQRS